MTTQLTTTKAAPPTEPAVWWQPWLNGVYVVLGAMTAGWAVGWLGIHVVHDTQPLWLLARISGLAAMILLTGLVSLGLLLAHPRGTMLRSINRRTLLSIHMARVPTGAVPSDTGKIVK